VDDVGARRNGWQLLGSLLATQDLYFDSEEYSTKTLTVSVDISADDALSGYAEVRAPPRLPGSFKSPNCGSPTALQRLSNGSLAALQRLSDGFLTAF
jgi:hypothetical protein